MIPFFKYHGAGNDFVLIDNRENIFSIDNKYIHNICHRRTGIGADGLILLNRSTESHLDFDMQYFNADGYEGTMCGNGGRCVVAFAYYLKIIDKRTVFKGIDGIHHAEILAENNNIVRVNLQMTDVDTFQPYQKGYFLDTGSPHAVLFQDNIANFDVFNEGKKIRHDKFFPNGTNVDFVEKRKDSLFVRTFERGVEDETLSCGTGVTASAIAWAIADNTESPINIQTLGGKFVVRFHRQDKHFSEIWLEGDTCQVFEGKLP